MSTCADIEPQLSEFVDGDLDAAARAHVHAHLATCPRCAGLAMDFERLRTAARSLGPVTPPAHVWTTLAARIAEEPAAARSGRPAAHLASWIAVAAAVVMATGGTYLVYRQSTQQRSTAPVATSASTATAPATVGDELTQAMKHYDSAIADLQATATSGTKALDPKVAATLQHNLGVLDHAIEESRTAVGDDPTSVAARDSLFEALQQKVNVLQDTVALINDARPSDAPAGAGLVK